MDDILCEKGSLRVVNKLLGTDYKEDAGSYYINDLIPKEEFYYNQVMI